MNNNKPINAAAAGQVIADQMSDESLMRLAEQLKSLIDDPGFGEIRIVIVDHKVKYIHSNQSFRY